MPRPSLDAYRQQSTTLAAHVDDLRAVALALGRDDDAHGLLHEVNRLHEHRFQIVVVGEFSRGKSTLVNALIGRKLLPAKLRPTTAALTHIQHGEQVTVRVTRATGGMEHIEPEQIATVVTGDGAAGVSRVDVRVPCSWLADGVELIDTPGVNDLNESREDITLRFLPNADAALFVLDAKSCFTETERSFLARDVVRSNLSRVFFVINKVDQLREPSTVPLLIERVRGLTKGIVDTARIFAVAAKPALDAQLAGTTDLGSGVQDLISALSSFLATERGDALLLRVGAIVDATADRLNEGIALRLAALEGEAAGARGLLAELQQDADRQSAELARLRAGWALTVSAVAEDARCEVRRRANDVARPLAAGFDSARGAVDLEGVHAAVKRAFGDIAGEGQRLVNTKIQTQARLVADDVSALEATTRRVGSDGLGTSIARVGVPETLVTPTSALVAAGAMGLATALSIASGGVLLIGVLAFFAARTHEAEDTVAVARRNLDRLIEQATEQLCAALADQARSLGEAAWTDVGFASQARVAESRRSLEEAHADLGKDAATRAEDVARLRSLQRRLGRPDPGRDEPCSMRLRCPPRPGAPLDRSPPPARRRRWVLVR